MNIQEHIDAILNQPVFKGELYYIQHPDPDGSAGAVAETFGVFSILGGECWEDL